MGDAITAHRNTIGNLACFLLINQPMMSCFKKIVILVAIAAMLPSAAWALSITKVEQTKNTLATKYQYEGDPKSDRELYLNKQDCKDKVKITIWLDGVDSSSGNDVFFFVGDDCEENDCDVAYRMTANEVINSTFITLKWDELFSDTAAFEGCNGDGSTAISVAQLESATKKKVEDGANWALEEIAIEYDMVPPSPINPISALPGSGIIQVNWSYDDGGDGDDTETTSSDADVQFVAVVYSPGGAEIVEDSLNSEDTEIDSEEDTGVTPEDTGVDTENTGIGTGEDTANDAGAGDTGGGIDTVAQPLMVEKWMSLDKDNCPDEATGLTEGANANLTGDGGYKISAKKTVGAKSATAGGLTNGTAYEVGLIALDKFMNPSVISETGCMTPIPVDSFIDDYEEAGGKTGKFCFIATAAFGSYDHPTVKILRHFRDDFLEPLPGGAALIQAYYRVGPLAALAVQNNEALRTTTRAALTVFAGVSIPFSTLGPYGVLLFGVLLVVGTAVIRRRRAR